MDFQTQAIKNSAQGGAYNFEDSHEASPAEQFEKLTPASFSLGLVSLIWKCLEVLQPFGEKKMQLCHSSIKLG